jgi:hypothetical protein
MKQLFNKWALLLYFAVFFTSIVSAQVKIGSNPTTVNSSTILEIESTNKGFLMPRITLTSVLDVETIANPANGLLIFNTATAGSGTLAVSPGYYYFNTSKERWYKIAIQVDQFDTRTTDLNMEGNSIANALAVRAGNFQIIDQDLHPFFNGDDESALTILNREINKTKFLDGRTGSTLLTITNSSDPDDEFGTPSASEGRLGVNTDNPVASADLTLGSNNKGFLMNRVALTESTDMTTIANPAKGLLVYNTATAGIAPDNVSPGFYYFDGTNWQAVVTKTALNLKEDVVNKSVAKDLGAASSSDVFYPSQLAVKTYVDNKITSSGNPVDATNTAKGILQLAGDLGGTGSTAAAPIISDAAITTSKLVDDAITNDKIADNSIKNVNLAEKVSVAKGGTGSNLLSTAGYVKQETAGANFTTVTKIPVADVDGAVRKVNGVVPDANGNVATILGRVITGNVIIPETATAVVAINTDAITANDIRESDIYIVAGNSNNSNNGRTFIYNGTVWLEVATNLAATDARYVNVAGDIMEGTLEFPAGKKLKLADAPIDQTDGTNKKYVDDLVLAASSFGMKSIVKKITDYTISATDYTILVNATSGAFTLTLPDPTATSNKGRILLIRKTDETTNVLTFSRAIKISETRDFTTLNMNTTIRIQCDGTDWYKID